MSRRAFTLIECLIVVAILGISVGTLASVARHNELAAFTELQRERALLLLEYQADCLLAGRPLDPEVVARLVAQLPVVSWEQRSQGQTTTLSVRWRDPLGGPSTRSLTLFAPAARAAGGQP